MVPTPRGTRTRRAHESAWRVDVPESIWTAPIECQTSAGSGRARGGSRGPGVARAGAARVHAESGAGSTGVRRGSSLVVLPVYQPGWWYGRFCANQGPFLRFRRLVHARNAAWGPSVAASIGPRCYVVPRRLVSRKFRAGRRPPRPGFWRLSARVVLDANQQAQRAESGPAASDPRTNEDHDRAWVTRSAPDRTQHYSG